MTLEDFVLSKESMGGAGFSLSIQAIGGAIAGYLYGFIFPPAAHARETKGYAAFMAFAFSDAFKGDFKNN